MFVCLLKTWVSYYCLKVCAKRAQENSFCLNLFASLTFSEPNFYSTKKYFGNITNVISVITIWLLFTELENR